MNDTEHVRAISGLIALDQSSCPMYLAEGQVTNCRCHVTARGKAYMSDLRVEWHRPGNTKIYVIEADGETTVLAHKYKGFPSKYECEAKNSMNETVEVVVYSPVDIDHKVTEYTKYLMGKLSIFYIATLVNLAIFIGVCSRTVWRKKTTAYKSEIVRLSIPAIDQEVSQDKRLSRKSAAD
ncbi:hypothetical protein ElyMa_005133700 [Elysia marginata]|uniref:Ig-like domain-containing protein n=1 Tax=Elysia marginata TaxID=1093978 RepID=A0AAV4JM62_9GAST|nr:hypothetical protein ElyMa_005133700 [Elysia marginata]